MGRKILILSYRDLRHPEMGGAEVILHQIYKRIRDAGNEVTFLTCRFPGCSERDEIDGMEVIRIGNLYNFNFLTSHYYKRQLKDRGYDVIVEDLNKLPFYTPAFEKDVPTLVNVPHLFGTTVFQQAPFPLALYVYLQERTVPRVYRGCRFQVLSDSTHDDLLARGIPADRLQVIRSGIDHDFYRPPARNGQLPKPVLLYLGRLKKYKCIEHPIRVLPGLLDRMPGVEYWIVGEGDYLDDLRRIARETGVERQVRFLGYKEGGEKLDLLNQTRVLVYTSPKEGWGLSVIEANALGIPCVASDSPGLRESVQHDKTGFLVPHGDLDALGKQLERLLTDDVLWKKMSSHAIEWAARFSWDGMAGETLELIDQVIAEHKKGGRA